MLFSVTDTSEDANTNIPLALSLQSVYLFICSTRRDRFLRAHSSMLKITPSTVLSLKIIPGNRGLQ